MEKKLQFVLLALCFALTTIGLKAQDMADDSVSVTTEDPVMIEDAPEVQVQTTIEEDSAAIRAEAERLNRENQLKAEKLEQENLEKAERLNQEEKAAKESLKASRAELRAVRAEKKARKAERKAQKAQRKAEKEKRKLDRAR